MTLPEFIYGRTWTSRIGLPLLVGVACAFVGLRSPNRNFAADLLICSGTFGIYKEFMDWTNEQEER